ncbi:N-(5'-phosphoribosyl)anthranilate isomerase [bioreactor metagenome]|uniref:phosphoribosylanthranilate isomerase n=1 Tax=bioreactor metagenome TaxID=1076179 RepID=A0A644W1F3_9ZZZZ|nr:phosphoribosylanthranilate isomerase [Negativicutes bacterium]
MIGFVFAPSKRQIAVGNASDICRNVKGVAKVGVFVDAPFVDVINIAHQCRLDFVQLHGSESPDYCRQMTIPVIKALRINEDFAIGLADEFQADYILCDSFVPGCQGGSGVAFNWQKAKPSLQKIKTPILVAGGLNAYNIKTAICSLNPSGVDVSGGVETDGAKDGEKIREFIKAVRAAEGGSNA